MCSQIIYGKQIRKSAAEIGDFLYESPNVVIGYVITWLF